MLKPTARFRFRDPWLVLAVALLLTLLATALAHNWVQARREALIETSAAADVGRLSARFDAFSALLRGTRAMIETRGGKISRDMFERYVEQLQLPLHYRGVQGIGYSPRVDPAGVRAFEAAARREGYDGFSVFPSGPRDWMFSILHLEPLDARNRAAIGYDMYSEPVRAEAMARARDTALPALTDRVTLKQEIDATDVQAGFLLYVPLYRNGDVPLETAARRDSLTGYVYSPLRAADFFGAVFDDDETPHLALRAYAGNAVDPARLLFDGWPSGLQPSKRLTLQRTVGFAGQPMTLHFAALPSLTRSGDGWPVPVVALVGALLSALLFQLSRAQARSRAEVEAGAAAIAQALQQERLQRQRVQALHAQTEAQKRVLDLLIEQSGEGIAMADEQGVLRIFNPAAERQHGVTLQQLAAPAWAEAYGLHTIDRQPMPLEQAPLYRAVHGEVVRDARWSVRRPDGVWRVLAGTATPLRDADGRSAGAVLIVRDETERLQAEQERQQLLDALMRSNAELDQFAYVTSHDLKAPLRGIANLAQWIKEDFGGPLGDDVANHLRLLKGRVHRMEGLIDGILQYSRAGRAGVPAEPVDVGPLLAEAIELLAPPPGAEVEVVEPMPVVPADRTALQQVLMNLIGNALKHGAGAAARVRVEATDDGSHWRFRITDNGPGIAAQYHERIWGIFQTLQARDKVEGTGIGLAIVRKTVLARGGRAWVESSEGQGASFCFTWPK